MEPLRLLIIRSIYVQSSASYLLALLTLIAAVLSTASYAEDYPVQRLFNESESGVFHDLQSGKLLKTITDQNRTVYLEQDGDIFEEDVATLDVAPMGLRSSYSFSKSKRLLGSEVYTKHLLAFYSGCRYRLVQKKFIPVASSCGFKFRKNKNRSERIEWEHIVPAWHFGHQLRCWQDGGRLHCRNNNEQFRQMEADMHNLVPAIGEINGDRSNYKFGMISGEPRLYGKNVNMEIVFPDKTAEPPESVQGDIARAYFYMVDRYQLQISNQQKQLFIAWNNQDPVDSWEREKNQRVKELQGDENQYITHYKKLKQGDVVSSDPSTDLKEINQTLLERFQFLYDYLPDYVVETLVLLVALFLWWRNTRRKKQEQAAKESTKDEEKPVAKEVVKKQAVKKKVTQKQEEKPVQAESKPGYQKIQSALNNFVLSVTDEGLLIVEKSSRAHAQRWTFEDTNKSDGFVFIQHVETGKVLAVENALKKDDAPVVLEQQKRRLNDHQEWKLVADAAGEMVFIENRATGYVLDIVGKKKTEDAEVASHHRKTRGTENQCWRLV